MQAVQAAQLAVDKFAAVELVVQLGGQSQNQVRGLGVVAQTLAKDVCGCDDMSYHVTSPGMIWGG